MQNDEREMIVCCAQVLLSLPVSAEAREKLELVASALCSFAVANDAEREYIMDGQYREILHIQQLMDCNNHQLDGVKAWVKEMLAREIEPVQEPARTPDYM